MHRDPGRVRRAALIGLRIHTAAAVAAIGICWVIWLAIGWGAGAWYPWPAWPTLGVGLGVLGHAVPVWAVVGPRSTGHLGHLGYRGPTDNGLAGLG